MPHTQLLAKLLSERPGLTVDQIVEALGWSKIQVNRTLDSLRTRGVAASLPKRYELTIKGAAELVREKGFSVSRAPYKRRKDAGIDKKPKAKAEGGAIAAQALAGRHPLSLAWGAPHA